MNGQPKRIYEFGPFSLNPERRLLLRGEECVQLMPKVLDTLLALVENRGRILTKDELLQQIWGEIVVEEGGLARNVSVLRKALGEQHGEHRYIVTVPGKGYQFVAEVRERCESGVATPGEPALPAVLVPVKPRPAPRMPVIAALLTLLLGVAVYLLVQNRAVSAPPAIRSVAVLPFDNVSGDDSPEYIAYGMTDAVTGFLHQIEALRVTPLVSVMSLDGGASLKEIQSTLQVDAIVRGEVHIENERIDVQVRLVAARTGAPLWNRDYERDRIEVQKLHAEIARDIADAIGVHVTPAEHTRITASSVNQQAYDAYRIGVYHLSKFNWKDNEHAIEQFNLAVETDPNYAQAWAGLAQAWYQAGIQSMMPLKDVESHVREAAARALTLDEGLAEAHIMQGNLKMVFDRDWRGAENSLRRAIDLDGNNLDARIFHAKLLMLRGSFPEALREIEIAYMLDPASAVAESTWGLILYRTGEPDAALEHLERAVARDPGGANGYTRIGYVYAAMGRVADALAAFDTARQIRGNPETSPPFRAAIAEVYAMNGRRAEAQQMVDELGGASPYTYAANALLGNRDQAFAQLFKRGEDQSETVLHVKTDPSLKDLHEDPRWPELLRFLGFPEE